MESGQSIPVFGDGSMSRDYTCIDDIVHGVLCTIERCEGCTIFNLGESQPILLRDLVTGLEAALETQAIIDRRPLQPGDVQTTFADISRARREIGYNPKMSFATGLARFVHWFRQQKSANA